MYMYQKEPYSTINNLTNYITFFWGGVGMESKSALIISNSKFPNGDAAAVRQYNLAKLLIACNYTVSVICNSVESNDTQGTFESIQYYGYFGSQFGFKKYIQKFNRKNYFCIRRIFIY